MAPPTNDARRRCTHCQTLVDADALFCPACREPMATSLFSLDTVAAAGAAATEPTSPVAVDRRAATAGPPAPAMASGLELALPTRCKVCGAALTDETMQLRGTCVLHAHVTGADARPLTTTTITAANGLALDDDGARPPGTSPVGALVALVVVVALGAGTWWWLGRDAAPDDGAVTALGGGPTVGAAPASAAGARVDELLGSGAAGRLADASSHPAPSPSALAKRDADDEVSAEVEQLIAQSGHPTAPDLGEYESILDGTADAAPGPTARALAAMGQLDDDAARDVALRKLDALQKSHPDDTAIAIAHAEVHVDDDPDGALVAAARTSDVVDAARLRGRAFARKGDVDGAVAALAATADRDPRATRALVSLQASRGRCADALAPSGKLAAARGGQAVVDHVRLLGACRPTLDDARALVDAVVRLPATTDAERAALRGALAEAALSRGVDDVADRACAELGDGDGAPPDVARARRRCALVRAGSSTTAVGALATATAPSATALLGAFGVRDARRAPWGRAGAQLRWLGALHDGAAVAPALVDVVEALWSPAAALTRVPAFGRRELAALVDGLVPAARRPVALAIARGLGGDVNGGLEALGDARDADAAGARATLLVAAGRPDEARRVQPAALAKTVVGRAVAALAPSSSPAALRALLADPHVGPRAFRALVERGASSAADVIVAQRFGLHPDVVAANGR